MTTTLRDSPVILVTGANKGIGLETVRRLVGAGHRVYLGARDAATLGSTPCDWLINPQARAAAITASTVALSVRRAHLYQQHRRGLCGR